jgi:DNA adenine methylase
LQSATSRLQLLLAGLSLDPYSATLKFQITSRSEFERLAAVDPDTLADLERAARFLYLQRAAFGGKVTGRSFGTACGVAGRFDTTKLGPILEAIQRRSCGPGTFP